MCCLVLMMLAGARSTSTCPEVRLLLLLLRIKPSDAVAMMVLVVQHARGANAAP